MNQAWTNYEALLEDTDEFKTEMTRWITIRLYDETKGRRYYLDKGIDEINDLTNRYFTFRPEVRYQM